MAACSHTSNCELFPMISVNSSLKIWRTFYCEGKWHECARFKLSLSGKSVPPNLLPNGKSLDLSIGTPQAAKNPAPAAVKSREASMSTAASVASKTVDIKLDTPTAPVAVPAPTVRTAPAAAAPAPAPAPEPSGDTKSYYLRMEIVSETGVMTQIIRSLGQSHVRIDAVTEKKGANEKAPSYLIVLTDQVDENTLGVALTALEKLSCINGQVKRVALETMTDGRLG